MKSKLLLLLAGVVLALAGCSKKEATASAAGHHHHAPNGGMLVELGEHQFNLEIKFDEARGVLQAWVLDGHAENFVRIAQSGLEVQATAPDRARVLDFVAVANTMTGETAGDTALFEVPAEWLRTAKAFDGRLKAITVRGVTFNDVAFRYSVQAQDHGHAH
jgi:hypothetical protein